MTKGKSFVGTLPRMDWLADWPIRFVLMRFSLSIAACTHTHSQTQGEQVLEWSAEYIHCGGVLMNMNNEL